MIIFKKFFVIECHSYINTKHICSKNLFITIKLNNKIINTKIEETKVLTAKLFQI